MKAKIKITKVIIIQKVSAKERKKIKIIRIILPQKSMKNPVKDLQTKKIKLKMKMKISQNQKKMILKKKMWKM